MEAWLPTDANEHAVFLEDDAEVSPFFLEWAAGAAMAYLPGTWSHSGGTRAMDNHAAGAPRFVLGLSLYRPIWNEISWTSLKAQQPPLSVDPAALAGSHAFLLQLPSSWGVLLRPGPWKAFRAWWRRRRFEDPAQFRPLHSHAASPPRLPRSFANGWANSWKRYLLRFMVERHLFLVYPNIVETQGTSGREQQHRAREGRARPTYRHLLAHGVGLCTNHAETLHGTNVDSDNLRRLYHVPVLRSCADADYVVDAAGLEPRRPRRRFFEDEEKVKDVAPLRQFVFPPLQNMLTLDMYHQPTDNPAAALLAAAAAPTTMNILSDSPPTHSRVAKPSRPRPWASDIRCWDSYMTAWCHIDRVQLNLLADNRVQTSSEETTIDPTLVFFAADRVGGGAAGVGLWSLNSTRDGENVLHKRSLLPGYHQFRAPLMRPAFRHRAYNVAARPLVAVSRGRFDLALASGSCTAHARKRAFLVGAFGFPQYGHTVHDLVMALFATLTGDPHHAAEGPPSSSSAEALLGGPGGRRNNLVIITGMGEGWNGGPSDAQKGPGGVQGNVNTQLLGAFTELFGVLSTSPPVLLSGLSALLGPRPCFDRVVLGVSNGLNMYEPTTRPPLSPYTAAAGEGDGFTVDRGGSEGLQRRGALLRRFHAALYEHLGLLRRVAPPPPPQSTPGGPGKLPRGGQRAHEQWLAAYWRRMYEENNQTKDPLVTASSASQLPGVQLQCEGLVPAAGGGATETSSRGGPTAPALVRATIVERRSRPPNSRARASDSSGGAAATVGRVVTNRRELYVAAAAEFHTVRCVDTALLSFREQIQVMAHTHVLVGVQGTGLLNAMFLPPDAAVVMLVPYGVRDHLGTNLRNLALAGGSGRTVYRWHGREATDSRFYAEISHGPDSEDDSEGGRGGAGWVGEEQEREARRRLLSLDPDEVWRRNWLAAFTFFMNADMRVDPVDLRAMFRRAAQGLRQAKGPNRRRAQ